MKKWNLNTVKNYVEGLDLECDIEELERDLEFMIAVIDYTNDPKMYELCGDEIKYNYELIKHLIMKFNNNTSYIIKLAEDYFNKTRTLKAMNDFPTLEYLEVLLTLDKCLKPKLEDEVIIQKLRAKTEYVTYRVSFETALDIGNISYDHGTMGFDYLEYVFAGSVLIKDYFAYNMIDEIFSSNNIERILHESYKEKPESVVSTFIELIKRYDLELAYYIAARIKEFDSYVKEIEKYIARWGVFETNYRLAKSNDVVDAIYLFLDEYGYSMLSTDYQLLTYFGNKYDLMEDIKEIDPEFEPEELDLKKKDIGERGLIKRLDNIIGLIVAGDYDAYVYNNKTPKCEIKQYKLPVNK